VIRFSISARTSASASLMGTEITANIIVLPADFHTAASAQIAA